MNILCNNFPQRAEILLGEIIIKDCVRRYCNNREHLCAVSRLVLSSRTRGRAYGSTSVSVHPTGLYTEFSAVIPEGQRRKFEAKGVHFARHPPYHV